MKKTILINKGYNLLNELYDDYFEGFYAGDLLSFVMSHAKQGEILLTITNNLNSVAVAELLDLPGIIFCEDVMPSKEMINKASEEGISLFTTPKTKVEIIKEFTKDEILL